MKDAVSNLIHISLPVSVSLEVPVGEHVVVVVWLEVVIRWKLLPRGLIKNEVVLIILKDEEAEDPHIKEHTEHRHRHRQLDEERVLLQESQDEGNRVELLDQRMVMVREVDQAVHFRATYLNSKIFIII